MANRRMFSKQIIDSDAFLDMPSSTQNLYFHLSMRADDDGFVNNPKSIMRVVGGKDDDFKVLEAKKFVIPFSSGVVVIKHWKIHNYIQSDRYTPTKYQKEKSMLKVNGKGSYSLIGNEMDTQCIQDGYTMDTQVRLELGKVSIGKDSKDKDLKESSKEKIKPKSKRFETPTLQEIVDYVKDNYQTEPYIFADKFFNFYESKGWVVGRTPMKNWHSAVGTWMAKDGISKVRAKQKAIIDNANDDEYDKLLKEIKSL